MLNQFMAGVAPSRVRELKLYSCWKKDYFTSGRTLTGAWIETGYLTKEQYNHLVAPSRVRELKLQVLIL